MRKGCTTWLRSRLRALYAQSASTLALADLPRLLAQQLVRTSPEALPYRTSLGVLQPKSLHHPQCFAGSGLRPLTKILDCCLPTEHGSSPISIVADDPLGSATDHWLGEPLPHLLPSRPAAHLPATEAFGYTVFPPTRAVIPYEEVDSAVLLTRAPWTPRRAHTTCMSKTSTLCSMSAKTKRSLLATEQIDAPRGFLASPHEGQPPFLDTMLPPRDTGMQRKEAPTGRVSTPLAAAPQHTTP